MMWNPVGILVAHDWIEFDPIETLYEFDFPRIFTCKDIPRNLYLAYNCGGGDKNTIRFLVVPCNEDVVARLVSGQTNLRDCLTKYRAWLFDLDKTWQPVSAWKIDVDTLPPEALPSPGTMLYSHLQPVVSLNVSRSYSKEADVTTFNSGSQSKLVTING